MTCYTKQDFDTCKCGIGVGGGGTSVNFGKIKNKNSVHGSALLRLCNAGSQPKVLF